MAAKAVSADHPLGGDPGQMADPAASDGGRNAARLAVDHHQICALAHGQIAPIA